MTDCLNAEMRDRLPDLLHERLDASVRAVIVAHVEECVDCRAELALLREARLALSSGERSIDVMAVTRVVVERTRSHAPLGRRRSWTDWRIAASIATLLVGGGALLMLSRGTRPERAPEVSVLPTPATPPNASVSSHAVVSPIPSSAPRVPAATAELSAAGGTVSDLSESELRTLLQDLDRIDAVPATEPEPVSVRVSLPSSGGLE